MYVHIKMSLLKNYEYLLFKFSRKKRYFLQGGQKKV